MSQDEPNSLAILKAELKFLEDGSYRRLGKNAWRPRLIFEDSPTCLNYDAPEKPADCSHCPLIQFVPPDFRAARIPCRHIPLNPAGETLQTLYESADQTEIEAAVAHWLRSVIEEREADHRAAGRNAKGCGEGDCAPSPDSNQQRLTKAWVSDNLGSTGK